ncbi:MAG: exodeoxyribonuclease large subunit [Frankiaceae bacterium]|jgi:exodeoxyribonuclease VII large subunit|nr:exodeoxyribonuclease large subunit [Frankiaceae bacterium]
MPLESTAEQPLPVRTIARGIGDWIAKLGRVWVEGQLTEVSRRPGAATVFLTLRDPAADVSLRVTCSKALYDDVVPALQQGARVVVWAKPEFYLARGTLSLAAHEIRHLGVGDLLARVERLKAVLATEGLFAAERKRRLPFLPGTVGLICGRGSAAEHDVLENARRRWPAVRFAVKNVAVQGPYAVGEITDALRALDRDPTVDVIVLTRGGGSVEDLLPFSDESLCRAVFACRTPVVSAIGHEQDAPLLDFVADVRCSTPTDAAKRVVPDLGEEIAGIDAARRRIRRTVATHLDRERHRIDALRARPVLAAPLGEIDRHTATIAAQRDRARRCLGTVLAAARADLGHTRARVLALSPAATLDRGYAVVQTPAGAVVRAPGEVAAGAALRIRVADGEFAAVRS